MSAPPQSILSVFNRYRHPGGEEMSVERIAGLLSTRHHVANCRFESSEWTGPGAPSTLGQAWRLFYNPEGVRRFESALDKSGAALALLHNIFPVGSPAIYRSARRRGLPLMQFMHNYRPFSVGGTLYSRGRILKDPLFGHYWREVAEGAWMGSRLRSALMALLLKALHRSGWLEAVHTWIAISDFMRRRLIEAGAVHPARIVTLRHAWQAMPAAPSAEDAGHYLFLGRLVHEKGVATLLDAWDTVHQRLGRTTPRLHIAGEGPLSGLVSERARRNPFVCALGPIGGQSKEDQLRQARAVIVPSVWWEPLGLVTYEAYDHAKPVLAARSGGLAETVEHGQTGLLHEPGNAGELAGQIFEMEAMSATSRAALGHAGRRWLLTEANPARWLRQFDEILTGCLESAALRHHRTVAGVALPFRRTIPGQGAV
ncbi:MAG TPA: hypothetical protein DIT13_16695 [Verrucomicrobiales bacterium]|nr:hypothetical protein [Verrucomicrobiales bacterium]HRK12904.1 glycosyltransferase [Prosthecobacter sp.]